MNEENLKERAERRQLEVFLKLFNKRYGTDYEVGSVEPQNSIVDRMAVSKSGNWRNFEMQLKDVRELDTSEFTRSSMGEGVKVFNTNIFNILPPLQRRTEQKYRASADGVVLVFKVGVQENWLKDYILEQTIAETAFSGVYCLGLPSNLEPEGFIFPLKEKTYKK